MVRIQTNKKRHFYALIFTILIFIIGLFFGYTFTKFGYSNIKKINEEQRIEYDSLQLQYLYMIELLETKNCPAAQKTLEKSISALEKARFKLEEYSRRDKSLTSLKREYILAELRYWLLAKNTKKICEQDTVSILYFYLPKECLECETQGEILTYLKEKLKEKLLVFSIDLSFEQEPMVSIFKEAYNLNKAPTIILEDEKYEGLVKQDKLLKEICYYYKEKPKACK